MESSVRRVRATLDGWTADSQDVFIASLSDSTARSCAGTEVNVMGLKVFPHHRARIISIYLTIFFPNSGVEMQATEQSSALTD